MKVEYNNLYTHFVFTPLNRVPLIHEKHHQRIEKYITGIVNNNIVYIRNQKEHHNINKQWIKKKLGN